MPKYRVKPGFTHGAFSQHKAGAVVELTEEEAAGFLDKLEPADKRGYLWTDAPAPQDAPSSFARFAEMNATEVVEAAQAMSPDERAALIAWERAGKNRKTVLEALGGPQSGSSG